MLEIMSLLACLSQCLDATTLRQLCQVSEAMLSMTGRVTMRGISRWPRMSEAVTGGKVALSNYKTMTSGR